MVTGLKISKTVEKDDGGKNHDGGETDRKRYLERRIDGIWWLSTDWELGRDALMAVPFLKSRSIRGEIWRGRS